MSYELGDSFEELGEYYGKATLVFTSVPDLSELPETYNVGSYQIFLSDAMSLVSSLTNKFAVLGQSDRRQNGEIFSKAEFICEEMTRGFKLKDHKILLKKPLGSIDMFCLTYSHVLFFSKGQGISKRQKVKAFMPDVWDFHCERRNGVVLWNEDFVRLVIEVMTDEGDLVIDPFAGRGTVIKVAEQMNREAIGFEIDEELYEFGKDYMGRE